MPFRDRTHLDLDLDTPARIWTLAPTPSGLAREKARRAILAFAKTLPANATIADLRMELEEALV